MLSSLPEAAGESHAHALRGFWQARPYGCKRIARYSWQKLADGIGLPIALEGIGFLRYLAPICTPGNKLRGNGEKGSKRRSPLMRIEGREAFVRQKRRSPFWCEDGPQTTAAAAAAAGGALLACWAELNQHYLARRLGKFARSCRYRHSAFSRAARGGAGGGGGCGIRPSPSQTVQGSERFI